MENKLANLEARLINLENMLAQMQQTETQNKPFVRLSPKFINKLRPALEEGGPLADGRTCPSIDLREFSRPWRRLIGTLRLPETSPARIEAEALLNQLSVIYYKEGNARLFCTI